MAHQGNAWDREYRESKLVTNDSKPQADTLRFLKFLKKEEKYIVSNRSVLDIGCGTGRNANYLAELGNKVYGIEISKTAINLARSRALELGVSVEYILGDIGQTYPLLDKSIDIILDVTSSNSLNEKGRLIYLSECERILKKGGYMFVRALCKDGNDNVKNLLKNSPGGEYDTYFLKELGIVERVFSKSDIVDLYSRYFKIIEITKKTSYTRMNNRVYKRDFWLLYMTTK